MSPIELSWTAKKRHFGTTCISSSSFYEIVYCLLFGKSIIVYTSTKHLDKILNNCIYAFSDAKIIHHHPDHPEEEVWRQWPYPGADWQQCGKPGNPRKCSSATSSFEHSPPQPLSTSPPPHPVLLSKLVALSQQKGRLLSVAIFCQVPFSHLQSTMLHSSLLSCQIAQHHVLQGRCSYCGGNRDLIAKWEGWPVKYVGFRFRHQQADTPQRLGKDSNADPGRHC